MSTILRTMSDPSNYREVATLWIAVSTLLGLGGVVLGSLAVLFAHDAFRNDEISVFRYLSITVGYFGLVICPILGWAFRARRRYWAAMTAAAWPIICFVLTFPHVARW